MASLEIKKADFVKSAASKKDFILDGRPKIVFAGKSNVGKSSIINSLSNRKNLARVGAAPGKTTTVNYFLINDSCWFIDLPGYGYAKVSMEEKARWGKLMEDYFSQKDNFTFGIQIVDSRHKPTDLDCVMNELFSSCDCKRIVVANKIDKLKKSEIDANMKMIRETFLLEDTITVLPYSAEKKIGRHELLGAIGNVIL